MNNKGFAITTILYGTMILFLMLILSMLGILSSYKDKMDLLIESDRGARTIINFEEIGSFDMSNIPPDYGRMSYSIDTSSYSDYVVTVTAKKDDGYGYVPYYVRLEKGKTYVFDCDTNGKWGNQVEAFLMKDSKHVDFKTTTVQLYGNNYYFFKAPADGLYTLRLDVNNSGKTYKFYNIAVLGVKS